MELPHKNSLSDSVTLNDGSVVGLPNSSSDEEDSTDELTRAADTLCKTLYEEHKANSCPTSPQQLKCAITILNPPSNSECETGDIANTVSSGGSEANDDQQNQLSLEERVQELETKLATLSRILQQQQRLSSRSMVRMEMDSAVLILYLYPFYLAILSHFNWLAFWLLTFLFQILYCSLI